MVKKILHLSNKTGLLYKKKKQRFKRRQKFKKEWQNKKKYGLVEL